MLNLRFYWTFRHLVGHSRHFVGHSDRYRVTFSTDRDLAEPVILVFINYMHLQGFPIDLVYWCVRRQVDKNDSQNLCNYHDYCLF